MVGVPRSTGCSTCVKRRIKASLLSSVRVDILIKHQCDETRPECDNCLKYGTKCPGYDKGLKFVIGKPLRTKRSRAAVKTNATSQGILDSLVSSSSTSTGLAAPIKLDSSIHPDQKYPFPQFRSGLPSSPESADEEIQRDTNTRALSDIVVSLPVTVQPQKQYQQQLINSICDMVPGSTDAREIQMSTTYLRQLPDRFGNSKALDAAIVAFTTQQLGTTSDDMQMIRCGQNSYVQALTLLQRALNRRDEALSSETHATALLLCTYEVRCFSRVELHYTDICYCSFLQVQLHSIRG